MLSWDDMRIYLAVAREGGLAAAARKLGIDHTTVARRITALERAFGARLADRSPRGVRLTDAGEALRDHAERMEAEALAASARLGGLDQALSGSVRLATPEAFGVWLAAPAIGALAEKHPDLTLELVPAAQPVNLTKRDADIAVTMSRPVRGRLYGQKLTDYSVGLYASRTYLERTGPVTPSLSSHRLVGYIDDLIDIPELRYLDEGSTRQRPGFRSSSVIAQQAAVAAGAGIGLLHVFAAEQDPDLVRVLADSVDIRRSYWIAVHADQRDLPRIRAVVDFLHDLVRARRHGF